MKFYVYEHWRPDEDVPFYVGKGKGRRAFSLRRNNRQHKFVVDKLGRLGMCAEVRLVASDLSESDAFKIERERIAFWRSVGVRLANVSDGGGGYSGFKHTQEFKEKARIQITAYNERRGPPSEETREKMRAAKLGKKQSPEHVAKAAAASRGRKYGPKSPAIRAKISASKIGSRASEETRAKMSSSHTGRPGALKGRSWSEKRRAAQIKLQETSNA